MKDMVDNIKNRIYNIRGKQVMLDNDLAELYQVETRRLNEQVKRNIERFPEDFCFQLKEDEFKNLKSQIATSSLEWGGRRKLPYVFTQEGIAMLSGILRSKIAIEVNIKIMRAFIEMRKFLLNNSLTFQKFNFYDNKLIEHDNKINILFDKFKNDNPKQGIFFNGQIFDAYEFVNKLIKQSKRKIILIDNYIDESILTLFSITKLNVTIYTKNINEKLKLDLKKYNSQYNNIEIKEFDKSHDRFLIIDEEIYHFGASLKDLGKKIFGFSKMSNDNLLGVLDKLEKK